MNIDELKMNIERLVNICIKALAKDNSFFDATENKYELKSNKDSETIYLCKSAVLRVKQSKDNKTTLEFSKKYIDLFKLQDEVRYTKSEVNWGRLTFDESIAKQIIDNIEAVFKQCYMEGPVESFGCCSRYNACSDEKKCINPDIKDAQGCMYKRNLESGRIFYGNNCNIEYLTTDDNQSNSAKTADFGIQSSFQFQTENS